jgi:hypothetical protein
MKWRIANRLVGGALVCGLLLGCPGGGECVSTEAVFINPVATLTPADGGLAIDLSWTRNEALPPGYYRRQPEVQASLLRLVEADLNGARFWGPERNGRIALEATWRAHPCSHILKVRFEHLPDGGYESGIVTPRTEIEPL